jgi:hypothetical protein
LDGEVISGWALEGTMVKRDDGVSEGGAGRVTIHVTTVAIAATPATAANPTADSLREGAGAAGSAAGNDSASSISNRAAAAESSRRFRSFSRQRRRSFRIDAGVSTGSAVQSGSDFSTAART